jgi:hypothetical protein
VASEAGLRAWLPSLVNSEATLRVGVHSKITASWTTSRCN